MTNSHGRGEVRRSKIDGCFRFQKKRLAAISADWLVVEEVLGVSLDTVDSIVAFMGGGTFKTPMPDNVTRGIGHISYIRRHTSPVFSEQQLQTLVEALESGRLQPSRQTHRDHVANLKKRADPAAYRVCPSCVSPMVVRTVRRGERAGKRF